MFQSTATWRSVWNDGAKWEDFTIAEKTQKGWALPYLILSDVELTKRWVYWEKVLESRKFIDPIPQIHFQPMQDKSVMKMLTTCLNNMKAYSCGARIDTFLEWILWGFGVGEHKPVGVSEELNKLWYENFNIYLLLQHPHDYFGDLLSESKEGKSYWTNPNSFFPTPHHVVAMMVEMTMNDCPDPMASIMDPCVGSGRFLMYASNKSLNLYGIDIDPTCVNACLINGFLYVPWIVTATPYIIEGMGIKMWPRIQRGDALTMGLTKKEEKPVEEKSKKQIQIKLFGR